MDKLYQEYSDQVHFYNVYIREAHPIDGWRMSHNDAFGIAAAQPTTDAERGTLADQCSSALHLLTPMLVDGINDETANAYSAFPDRLYVIDRDGKVAYKGGRGPFGFEPFQMEQALLLLLLDDSLRDIPGSP